MRKVILQMQVSLDGYVSGPNGEMDWMIDNSDEAWEGMFEAFQEVDTFLLGGGMYPDYAAYWRNALTDPKVSKHERLYAQKAEHVQHIVFSKSLKNPVWAKTRIVSDSPAEEVSKLKNQKGKHIMVYGGAALAASFINKGLVDEYRLIVNPVMLGGGKSLFDNMNRHVNLKLLSSKSIAGGVVNLRYEPA